jgi:hypothetical protein
VERLELAPILDRAALDRHVIDQLQARPHDSAFDDPGKFVVAIEHAGR